MVSRRGRRKWREATAGAERLEGRTLLTNYVVNTLADVVAADGKVSLREAIQAANDNAAVNEAGAGQGGGVVDQISFDPGLAGTIVLDGTQLEIDGDLRIVGSGAKRLAVSGNGLSRVFYIDTSSQATRHRVDLSGLTVKGGRATDGGGGIWNYGTLTLTECDVSGNVTTAREGGGIMSYSAELTLIRSVVSANVAAAGPDGGVANYWGSATIHNSTISGNRAAVGGGLYNDFDQPTDRLDLRNATIFGNRGGGIYHYDIASEYPTLPTMRNTIVAGNLSLDGSEAEDVWVEYLPFNRFTSTNNLIGDRATAGGMRDGQNRNIVGVDWRTVLDPVLRDNGGPTRTHRLLPGGRAVDAGLTDGSNPFPTDQRGGVFSRLRQAAIDIGAFEAAPADDLIGYLGGSWQVASSTGTSFVTSEWARWNDAAWVGLGQGDFDGDGRADVYGFVNGEWYVGRSTGAAFATGRWGKWNNAAWETALVGDFNGDGRDDVVGQIGGEWYGAASNGTTLDAKVPMVRTSNAAWEAVLLADVTGDGKDDLVLVIAGDWYVGVSNGTAFATAVRWTRFGAAAYSLLTVADLNGDGWGDAVGFVRGEWRVGVSNGISAFSGPGATALRAKWADAAWVDPLAGDFDGDGRDDLAARLNGQWYVGMTSLVGGEASRALWATWQNVAWKDVRVGDFDGDGRDDVAGRISGQWYVGRSTGGGFETTLWGAWAEGAWRAVAAVDATGPPSAGAPAMTSAAAFAMKEEEPLARFWSRADKDEEFGRRLLAAV